MESNTLNNMRDPQGNAERYRQYFTTENLRWNGLAERLAAAPVESQVNLHVNKMAAEKEQLRHQYGAGNELALIAQAAREAVETVAAHAAFAREQGGPLRAGIFPIRADARRDYAFAALTLLLVNDSAVAASLEHLISPRAEHRSHMLDLLLKAFVPAWKVSIQYKPSKELAPWSDPVVAALAQPPALRANALASHMRNWPRLMRPFGWSPELDTAPGKDPLFCDFAFEVALAVSGWDIDDSSFADHPYYPVDLVRYYRENIRHSRDAWRSGGAGAGVEISAPPPPAKSDLAKTKRKGIARWVELVSDGDQDATEVVLEAIGKPRKIKDVEELVQALGEAGIAIHADIKDDDAVAQQAGALGNARGLGEFDGPAQPTAGPARCTALLRAWEGWLASHDYRLVAIDAGDDAWHAIVVRKDYHGELQALSVDLAIPLSEPSVVFAD